MEGKANLSRLPNLTALKVSNGALKGQELPSRIKVFEWGQNSSTKGTFTAGNKTAELLPLNQHALGYERVAIDYNHCTVPGSPEFEKGKTPDIFGYGTVRVVPPKGTEGTESLTAGIWLTEIEWTPLGREKARNFEDLSPAGHYDERGEMDFLHSVALTPNGSLYNITFFSAQAGGANHNQTQNRTDRTNMNDNNSAVVTAENVITVAEFAPVVGLSASATKQDVLAKLAILAAVMALPQKDGRIEVLGADDLAPIEGRLKTIEAAATKGIATLSATVDGKVVTLSAEDMVKLEARIKAMEANIQTQVTSQLATERNQVITTLAAEGRVPMNPATGKAYTAEELRGLDVPVLRILAANTPVTVPLNARTRGAGATAGSKIDSGLKGRERTVAALEQQMAARQ